MTSDRQQGAEQNRQKEVVIKAIARIVNLISSLALVALAITVYGNEMESIAIGILICALILGVSNKSIGTASIYIKWYDTIIEQEHAKYLRYGTKK